MRERLRSSLPHISALFTLFCSLIFLVFTVLALFLSIFGSSPPDPRLLWFVIAFVFGKMFLSSSEDLILYIDDHWLEYKRGQDS